MDVVPPEAAAAPAAAAGVAADSAAADSAAAAAVSSVGASADIVYGQAAAIVNQFGWNGCKGIGPNLVRALHFLCVSRSLLFLGLFSVLFLQWFSPFGRS